MIRIANVIWFFHLSSIKYDKILSLKFGTCRTYSDHAAKPHYEFSARFLHLILLKADKLHILTQRIGNFFRDVALQICQMQRIPDAK